MPHTAESSKQSQYSLASADHTGSVTLLAQAQFCGCESNWQLTRESSRIVEMYQRESIWARSRRQLAAYPSRRSSSLVETRAPFWVPLRTTARHELRLAPVSVWRCWLSKKADDVAPKHTRENTHHCVRESYLPSFTLVQSS